MLVNAAAEKAGRARQNSRRPVEAALRSCRKGLIGIGVFSCIMNVLLLTSPFLLQIYDRVLTSRSVATLVALALIAVVLYMFYGLFEWIRSRLLVRLGQAFDDDLAEIAFDTTALQRSNGPSSAGDLRTVQQFVSSPALATLFDVPWFPIYLGVIFLLHPILGLLALLGAVILVVLAIANQAISHRRNLQASEYGSTEDLLMRASRQQVEPLKAMGMLDNVQRLWRDAHDKRVTVQTSAADWQSVFSSSSKTLRLVLQSAVLGVGAYLVIDNQLSPGALIAASIIFARALAPIDQSIAQWRVITGAQQAYERLKETLADIPVEPEMNVLALPNRTLTVADLSLAAPDGETILMEGVTFALQAGDGLGIIGPSGGGKSTLIRGMLGVIPPVSGEVRFDGATLDQWSKEQQSQFIGYLPQDIDFFPGTIAQNISRFDPTRTRSRFAARRNWQ
jgi:PrtD family type I secretion system ABC transporter